MTGVLVTGGTGKTGAALAALLRARGVAVRVASRTPAPDDPEAVRFDWHDDATHSAALSGMDGVFLVMPPSMVDPMPVVAPFLSEAERAGVRRVVLLGSAIPFPDVPRRLELEDRVRQRSGWVVLRASGFMQNFLPPHPVGRGVLARGEILTSSGSARVGWIDARDVAEAAVALLGDLRREVDSQYVLTGPEALSYTDVARTITVETGRPVRVVHADVEEVAADYRRAGLPESWADRLAGAEIEVVRGHAEQVSTAVPDLTGRRPRTVSDFVREHAGEWAGSGDRLAELAGRWCHMWNEDHELAHELMTSGTRQWSGRSGGLDDIVGPTPAVPLMVRWSVDRGPRYAVRLLAADGEERLAYTWDATVPDGSVFSGMDVNVLHDGRVADNWTMEGDRHIAGPDPAPSPASRQTLRDLVALWTGPDPTAALAPDVVLRSARAAIGDVGGRAAVLALLRDRGEVTVHREPALDPARGSAALMWTAADGVTGLELLLVRDERITEVRSHPADRPFRY